MKIIAIGGGEIGRSREDGQGSYPVETTAIDERIIELTGKKHPELLFIPTASGDSKSYYELIKSNFLKLGCSRVEPLYLSKSISEAEIEQKILSADAIYVGGGNTLRMLKIWKKKGVDKILKKAAAKNIVLAGLSAGSICWFNSGSSDSWKRADGSDRLIKVTGLGLINALNCPHYNAGKFRQTDLKEKMKKLPRLVAIALEDCTALEVVDKKFKIVKSKSDAGVYKVYWKEKKFYKQKIDNKEYMNLDELLSIF